jgi:hypothetical protein
MPWQQATRLGWAAISSTVLYSASNTCKHAATGCRVQAALLEQCKLWSSTQTLVSATVKPCQTCKKPAAGLLDARLDYHWQQQPALQLVMTHAARAAASSQCAAEAVGGHPPCGCGALQVGRQHRVHPAQLDKQPSHHHLITPQHGTARHSTAQRSSAYLSMCVPCFVG